MWSYCVFPVSLLRVKNVYYSKKGLSCLQNYISSGCYLPTKKKLVRARYPNHMENLQYNREATLVLYVQVLRSYIHTYTPHKLFRSTT